MVWLGAVCPLMFRVAWPVCLRRSPPRHRAGRALFGQSTLCLGGAITYWHHPPRQRFFRSQAYAGARPVVRLQWHLTFNQCCHVCKAPSGARWRSRKLRYFRRSGWQIVGSIIAESIVAGIPLSTRLMNTDIPHENAEASPMRRLRFSLSECLGSDLELALFVNVSDGCAVPAICQMALLEAV